MNVSKLATEVWGYSDWKGAPLERLERFAALVRAEALAEQEISGKHTCLSEKQEPVAWYDKIKGMEVSVDVSTGEDDDYYRVFGRVDGVMLESCGAQNDIILVIEESRNFAAPVDAKAIRAEAYQQGRDDMKEEAAKVADRHSTCLNDTPNVIAAAIRGLK